MEITTLLEYSERSLLRAWLQENHSKEKECWVVMSRSKTPPSRHTTIPRGRGRSPLLRMDWQHTQKTSRWQARTETISQKKEKSLDKAQYGPMHRSRRPWSYDYGRKAGFWERLRMGLPGLSLHSRAEKTNDGRSPGAKTGIIWKNVPRKISIFRGQTGKKSLIKNWGSHDYLEFSIIIPNFELF